MRVELLTIPHCPSSIQTGTRLRTALDNVGLTAVTVETKLIATSDDAAAAPFAGSPTILIDGVDAFPSDGRTSDLACRVYATDSGLAGLPTLAQLEDALRRHL